MFCVCVIDAEALSKKGRNELALQQTGERLLCTKFYVYLLACEFVKIFTQLKIIRIDPHSLGKLASKQLSDLGQQ